MSLFLRIDGETRKPFCAAFVIGSPEFVDQMLVACAADNLAGYH
jgi:hypothetical protein